MNHRVLLAAAGIAVVGAVTWGFTLPSEEIPTTVAQVGTVPAPPPVRASPRPTLPYIPPPAPKPKKIKVPERGSGKFRTAGGEAEPREGKGPVIKYMVEVEKGLPFDVDEFATSVHDILNDPRGWGRFERVSKGSVQLRVTLSSPGTTNRECLPLRTFGQLSCWNGRRAVINARRWAFGADTYKDLDLYRQYVISHEVGHGLGHGHRDCPSKGKPAPVMVQQTISLRGCKANPWPKP
ncbi:DUF3152 domain-containing protein [Herbidospora mongoliensis]|uniref:DUF3152 domain-containing protein n=1 Tax=Herbidospora mongoliensis TaxID=688067 RepID=UPI000A045CC8|nr:DUF3152 domain-containing protein [Herbidospora mongoliensis]